MSERNYEEQRLADLLKRSVPEPPRQLTYEEITVQHLEKSVKRWLMPTMAAAAVLIIGGAIGAVAATRPDSATPRATAAAQGTSPAAAPTPQPTSPGCPGTATPSASPSPTGAQGGSVTVPGVVGQQTASAEQVLQQAGLLVFVKTVQEHAVPAGTVLRQSPAQGTRVARDTVVSLTVAAETAPATPTPSPSSTSAAIPVPSATPTPSPFATAAPVPSPTCSAPAMPVPTSAPSGAPTPTAVPTSAPGTLPTPTVPTSAPSGAPTPTAVPTSPGRITVPDVVGLQEMRAQTLLQLAGFNVVVVSAPEPSGQPRGTVFKQSPPGGTITPQGSVITIYA
jgi:hypothetical protein